MMMEYDDWFNRSAPRSMMVNTTETFQQPAGFVRLKETKMAEMDPAKIEELREAAHLQSVMPTVEGEIAKMVLTTETKVYQAISKNTLTPEEALSYWMEMYAYRRLNTRLNSKAALANTVTETTRR